MKESGLNMDEIDAQAAVSFGYVPMTGYPILPHTVKR